MVSTIDKPLRLHTPLGIQYELLNGFPQYNFSFEGSTATAQYRVAAIDVRKFTEELIPPPLLAQERFNMTQPPALPGSTVMMFPVQLRVEPMDPSLPFDPFYADNDTIGKSTFDEPLSFGGHLLAYGQWARITVEYESGMPFDKDRPETFLVHTVSVGGEFLSLSEQGTKWRRNVTATATEDNTDFKAPLTEVIPTIEHQLRWRNVIEPPWETIRSAIGKLNNSSTSFLNNANQETVLFLGVTATQRFRTAAYANFPFVNPPAAPADGFTQKFAEFALHPWTLDFKFSEKNLGQPLGVTSSIIAPDMGWNYFYRPEKGQFEVLLKQNGDRVYATTDFEAMFKRDDEFASLAVWAGKIADKSVDYEITSIV